MTLGNLHRKDVVGANQVHLDKFTEGRLNVLSFKEDASVTLKKDIVTGVDKDGKTTYTILFI